MRRIVRPADGSLRGTLAVPGDKSLSHRAVLFAAMSRGVSSHRGVLDSADVRSTIDAVHDLGAGVDVRDGAEGGLDVTVSGWGAGGPTEPDEPIDCGNSGTTARLLLGVLAGWPIDVTLIGDETLSRRPMRRVMLPLEAMGVEFAVSIAGTLPLTVRGNGDLRATEYASPVASAQVKTAVLLAGLAAEGRTTTSEPVLSRDHTERLLPAFGVPVGVGHDAAGAPSAWVDGPAVPTAADIRIPGDPSSAAFMVAAALIVSSSDVTLTGVSVNPTRTGFLRVLERMGADVSVTPTGAEGAEETGTIRARRSPLRATVVEASEAPSLIDEVPILAVLAACAEGTTRFEGVRELRVKESDRLSAVAEGLTALGAVARTGDDWLEVDGPTRFRGAELATHGDHRLAMSYAVAALVAEGEAAIEGFEAVDVSYPGFLGDLESLGTWMDPAAG